MGTLKRFFSFEWLFGKSPAIQSNDLGPQSLILTPRPEITQAETLQKLEAASRSGAENDIEAALSDLLYSGYSADFVPVFIALLPRQNHSGHDAIVSALQHLRDPRAVDALYEAALVKYPNEDDAYLGIARRCTWALADIGTPEARLRLEMLAAHSNALTVGYAKKRLDNWDREHARKGLR